MAVGATMVSSSLNYCRVRALRLTAMTSTRLLHTANQDLHYEEAVRALNGLQTNAETLKKIQEQRNSQAHLNIPNMVKYLGRTGIALTDLDKLNVIHIAGTKGKGSTCAFVERIVREHGFKTGFFSSPHLVAVRERIRINGQPINKNDFSENFWEVYNDLYSKKEDNEDMPTYFKFLTVMALKVFLKEQVDVAVLEVGIGGEYDCTNVVRSPVVCGITTLDLDHTNILGNTLQSIAWHKSGIMKPGVPCFTVDEQNTDTMPTLYQRAHEKQCELFVVPPLESYGWAGRPLQIGLAGDVQYTNASLALQLSQYFINYYVNGGTMDSIQSSCRKSLDSVEHKLAAPFTLSNEEINGLRSVVWPGRTQLLLSGSNFQYFIDGAHTNGSMAACTDWFTKTAPLHVSARSSVYRVLIFHMGGGRNYASLLQHLVPCGFDLAIFTTNLSFLAMDASSDRTNFTVSQDQQHINCEQQRSAWIRCSRQANRKTRGEGEAEAALPQCQINTCTLKISTRACFLGNACIIFNLTLHRGSTKSVQCQINTHIKSLPCSVRLTRTFKKVLPVHVLVTGSLHLAGGFLGILDPSLRCDSHTHTREPKTTSLTDMTLYN
ncbi:unnamed protein product, partial [Meganyctiphanes norvegica]